MTARKPVVLCILDGWGIGAEHDTNAPVLARTPVFDHLMATCPHAELMTFGPDVGLPEGQMGNSEVGHTNIGAGRIVPTSLVMIDQAIANGSFAANPALGRFIAALSASGGKAHLLGIVSDGGVHGHVDHIRAAARIIAAAGVKVVVHAITDGRDVPPKSADEFVPALAASLPKGARIGTVTGRFFAMDRDHRWDRVARAWRALVAAEGEHAATPGEAVLEAYGRGESDEFIQPTVIDGYGGMVGGDGLFCLNFRADRAREILAALAAPGFADFDVATRPAFAALLGMAEYSVAHNVYMDTAFPKKPIVNTLGSWVAGHGLTQFRIAETEKYPHVTFFFNGGKEEPEAGETRYMAPSPKVATYDLKPEMSAPEVTEHLVAAIGKDYALIVVNYANPDMVGHTGDLQAAMIACETVDTGLGQVLAALKAAGGAMLITADHGNCETMVDPVTGGPHTAHTTNPVPVIMVGGPEGAELRNGRLADLAPTLLELMGLPRPAEMTGESLIER